MQFSFKQRFYFVFRKDILRSKFFKELHPLGFSFNFLNSSFSLINKFGIIGFGALLDGLYFIELQNDATYNSMHVT